MRITVEFNGGPKDGEREDVDFAREILVPSWASPSMFDGMDGTCLIRPPEIRAHVYVYGGGNQYFWQGAR